MRATTPSVAVPQLPSTSGIIDAALFNRVHDLILKHGKKDDDVYVVETDRLIIHTDFKLTASEAIILVLDKTTWLARAYGCQGLQEDMSECMEHCLYNNMFCFLDCRVPEEFYGEIVEEVKCECSYLPTEKAREIAFKARDEVRPEKLRELALLALDEKGGDA